MVIPSLKYIFFGVLAIVVSWLLFGPVQVDTLWWREVLNSGHTILFFTFSLILCRYRPYLKRIQRAGLGWIRNKYVNVFIVCLLFNISIELIQVLVHREVSIDDVYRGLLGAMAGISLAAMIEMRKAGQVKIVPVLSMSSLIFILVGTAPLVRLSLHYVERSNSFPVVMDFSSGWSESFVRYQGGVYSGIHIIEPEPDWREYGQLSFDILSHNDVDVDVGFRVHDNAHNNEHEDRYNAILKIRPGLNTFDVPLDEIKAGPDARVLDLASVSGVILFSRNAKEWDRLVVSNLMLN